MNEPPSGEPDLKKKDEDLPMLYCPRCNQRLTERKCKLICERCGYYMSCADYY
jgi:methionyl-tRNA synthetase